MNAGLVEMFKFFNITARNPATNCNRSQTNKLTWISSSCSLPKPHAPLLKYNSPPSQSVSMAWWLQRHESVSLLRPWVSHFSWGAWEEGEGEIKWKRKKERKDKDKERRRGCMRAWYQTEINSVAKQLGTDVQGVKVLCVFGQLYMYMYTRLVLHEVSCCYNSFARHYTTL